LPSTDPELRLKWRVAIKREDERTKKLWEPYESAIVCEKHFKPLDYKEIVGGTSELTGRTRRVLKNGTVPSVFERLKAKVSDADKKRRERAQRRLEQAPSSASTLTTPHNAPGEIGIGICVMTSSAIQLYVAKVCMQHIFDCRAAATLVL
jgi:hypothetical protein